MADLKKLLCIELKRQLSANGRCVATIPAGGEMLWKWFLALSKTRTVHQAGVNPIQFTEMQAYFRLHKIDARQDHIDALLAMDEVLMTHISARNGHAPEGVKTLPPISKTPITAGLIDAMFG